MLFSKTTKKVALVMSLGLLGVSTLSAVESVKADANLPAYNSNTIYNRYGQGGYSPVVENHTTDGYTLNDNSNYELFNFVSEHTKENGDIYRYWDAKSNSSVIHDESQYSLNNIGRKVYDFDSYGYQLPQGTDFSSKTFIGELNVDYMVYRYWK